MNVLRRRHAAELGMEPSTSAGIGATLVRECIQRARRSGAKILALHRQPLVDDKDYQVPSPSPSAFAALD
jgi:hypothetical protein